VAGSGNEDNAKFQITGSTLQTAQSLDFEADNSLSVRVRADDGAGGTFEKSLTITVTNANEAPTDIALSNSSVAENEPVGTAVGTLSATDPDTGDTHTFALVAGAGDADNASFQIDGSTLETNAVFDFETKSSYSVRVRATDSGSLTFEKQLTITVTNVNEPPTDINLSNSSISENQAAGTAVGTLSTVDDPGSTHTYSLVTGAGDTDNASFQIDGDTLESAAVFDFEVKSS
jgi:VCBS repeat-containing protein